MAAGLRHDGAGITPWPGQLEIVVLVLLVPQVLRYAIPGLGNVWQLVLKDSALVSVIGLVELMREAQVGAGSTREPFVFFCSAGALYLLIAAATGELFRRVERHTRRGFRTA